MYITILNIVLVIKIIQKKKKINIVKISTRIKKQKLTKPIRPQNRGIPIKIKRKILVYTAHTLELAKLTNLRLITTHTEIDSLKLLQSQLTKPPSAEIAARRALFVPFDLPFAAAAVNRASKSERRHQFRAAAVKKPARIVSQPREQQRGIA